MPTLISDVWNVNVDTIKKVNVKYQLQVCKVTLGYIVCPAVASGCEVVYDAGVWQFSKLEGIDTLNLRRRQNGNSACAYTVGTLKFSIQGLPSILEEGRFVCPAAREPLLAK